MVTLLVIQHFLVRLLLMAVYRAHYPILFCVATLLMLLQLCMALRVQKKNG
nr:MAG TPA: hypothetical protein [Bacteriophage sp.]